MKIEIENYLCLVLGVKPLNTYWRSWVTVAVDLYQEIDRKSSEKSDEF